MEYVRLGEIAYIQTGPFGSQLHQSDYSDIGVPVVMPKDLVDGKITEDGIARVSQYHADRLKRHRLEQGNIVFSRRGDVGRCAFVSAKEHGALCGTGCFRVEIKTDKAVPQYIFLQCQSDTIVEWVKNRAVGSTLPNLNTGILSRIPLLLPPISTQRKIASILSAYDSLIECNSKRIRLLEQMAENLYKEWFVRFRFPGHQNVKMKDGLPEGWKQCKVEEVFEIKIGRTPPRKIFDYFTTEPNGNHCWVSIADMRNGIFVDSSNEYLTDYAIRSCNMPMVPPNTVLLSFKLTVGQVAIATKEVCTNEAIAHFNTSNSLLREYTFLFLKAFNYKKLGNTSAIGNAINSTIVKNMPYVLPEEELLKQFSNVIKPIFDEMLALKEQIQNLTSQRDLLLPRLMSGKLEV